LKTFVLGVRGERWVEILDEIVGGPFETLESGADKHRDI
jgi:hypothetical protein